MWRSSTIWQGGHRNQQRRPAPLAQTLAAMRSGADVIVQAQLEQGQWAGWANVVLRVPRESAIGAWLYEPVETKLAAETRGATLMQPCLYGRSPPIAHAIRLRVSNLELF
jgi:hypothetical protein